MKKNIFLFVRLAGLFISTSVIINAQWVQTNGPRNGEISALFERGDTILAGINGAFHWSQLIDYWAIGWNYGNAIPLGQDDTFHNEWQGYRTKQNPKIELTASRQYEERGKYTVMVKVMDILGNDTTKAMSVEIG